MLLKAGQEKGQRTTLDRFAERWQTPKKTEKDAKIGKTKRKKEQIDTQGIGMHIGVIFFVLDKKWR